MKPSKELNNNMNVIFDTDEGLNDLQIPKLDYLNMRQVTI